MKKSIYIVAELLLPGMTALPVYAMEDMAMPAASTTAAQKNIVGKGMVISVDKAAGKVKLQHEAIPAIGWSAMTMDFKVTDKSVLDKVKKGEQIEFTLIKRGQEYLISNIK
jgi:Cu(I)/Ag(I) efflux system protein CusF